MLRPRRPRSALSSLSLHDSCHSNTVTKASTTSATTTTTTRWICPDVVSMDDSQSSCYSDSDDEEYNISEMKPPLHHIIITSEERKKDDIIPLCRVFQNRDQRNAQRALVLRTIMTLITMAAIAMNYISSTASTHNIDSIPSSSNTLSAIVTNEDSKSSSTKVRKRRLVEIPIPKMINSSGSTTISSASSSAHTSIRQSTPQKVGSTAVTVSIAQKAKIHRDAMKRLMEQYGNGPHLVEFQIRIWPENDPTNVGNSIVSYFTIEMAPVHMMPLSVHRFLQQVSDGLWDNTSFYMNAPHLIAAHPISANGRISKPRHLFLPPTSISHYTEYNSAYPHFKYTMGFVGNGPEFYINKVMNPQHTDPCFANVVIGRSIIDALFRMRGHDRTPDRIRPVEIITTRIIPRTHLHPAAMDEYVRTTILP